MSDDPGFLGGISEGRYGTGHPFPSSIESALGRVWGDMDRASANAPRPRTPDIVPHWTARGIGGPTGPS